MLTRSSIAEAVAAAEDPTAWVVPKCPCHPEDPVTHYPPARVARWHLMHERVLRLFEAAAPAALRDVFGDLLDGRPDPLPGFRASFLRYMRQVEVLEHLAEMSDDRISDAVRTAVRSTYEPFLSLLR